MHTLSDRLLEFARDQNLELLGEFETLRGELIAGRTTLGRERCDAWRAHLAQHVSWEEGQVFAAYQRRCRPEDLFGLEELVRDHRLLSRMAEELSRLLERQVADSPNAAVRELVDDIDAILIEHRLHEETEICAALDHALDGPTIERIEVAFDAAGPGRDGER